MDFSFSDLNLQLDGQLPINFNSVENLPGFEARAAFTVKSASVFREDVDIVPTIVESLADAEAGEDGGEDFGGGDLAGDGG